MVILNNIPDVEAPVLSCPDLTVNTDVGVATASNVYQSSIATDNSGEVTVTCDPPFGSTFNISRTSVMCVANDSSGNEATCQFQVDVKGKRIKITMLVKTTWN